MLQTPQTSHKPAYKPTQDKPTVRLSTLPSGSQQAPGCSLGPKLVSFTYKEAFFGQLLFYKEKKDVFNLGCCTSALPESSAGPAMVLSPPHGYQLLEELIWKHLKFSTAQGEHSSLDFTDEKKIHFEASPT